MNKHCQILVVDDDTEDQLILDSYFQEAGKQDLVGYRENGREALSYLEQIDHDALLPRLIVLDLNMPILNGTQTLFQLKQRMRFRNIPVIIFSTSQNETEKRKCMSLGAIDYMVKPLTQDECREIIKHFCTFLTR
ncbi:MAG TPA: response regulator [Chryseosolibacter sp.]|nr:response regulator [Chryseosolibacter sp.]